MNTLVQLMLSRRSVRQFTGAPVPQADLETIVKAGMAAPSAVNVQPWAFLVVTDRKVLDALCATLPYAKMLEKAGAAVIVCGLPGKDEKFAKHYWVQDCSAATENVLLAAQALGYGAVWTAVYPEVDRMANVRRECGIPEDAVPLCVVPIGVTAKAQAEPVPRTQTGKVHWNRWD